MRFDPPTLFVVLVVSMLTCTGLLLWSWLQNRREKSLLWLSAAYAVAGAGNILLALRDTIPDFFTIQIANAIVLYGIGLGWNAARAFARRPTTQIVPAGAALIWLLLALIPAVSQTFEWRVTIASLGMATMCLMAAREVWRSDPSRARVAVVVVFTVHAAAVLCRIPIAVIGYVNGGIAVPFEDPSFSWFAIESSIFVYALAVLMVTLVKERIETRLRAAALTDPLTGLPNRRALFDRANSMIAHGARYRRPTTVIVFDLDRFKQINDTYGHPVGDAVIRAFASAASATLRAGDCIGRIGGEEFAAILPDTDEACGRIAAERIMRAFAGGVADLRFGRGNCTASAGLSSAPRSTMSIEMMLHAADRALYEAKRLGGNQLRTAAALAA
ncbi:MAG: GGDEF domain-containing protein [Bauldia sp.]|nr:GGDEF domain-containing protein [Bauldia sp.]